MTRGGRQQRIERLILAFAFFVAAHGSALATVLCGGACPMRAPQAVAVQTPTPAKPTSCCPEKAPGKAPPKSKSSLSASTECCCKVTKAPVPPVSLTTSVILPADQLFWTLPTAPAVIPGGSLIPVPERILGASDPSPPSGPISPTQGRAPPHHA